VCRAWHSLHASDARPAKRCAHTALLSQGKMAWSLKTATYFGLWYFFNIFYNVANKKALNALNMPWLQSFACVGPAPPALPPPSPRPHPALPCLAPHPASRPLLSSPHAALTGPAASPAAVGIPWVAAQWALKVKQAPVLTGAQIKKLTTQALPRPPARPQPRRGVGGHAKSRCARRRGA
jgi:hypothetical protein